MSLYSQQFPHSRPLPYEGLRFPHPRVTSFWDPSSRSRRCPLLLRQGFQHQISTLHHCIQIIWEYLPNICRIGYSRQDYQIRDHATDYRCCRLEIRHPNYHRYSPPRYAYCIYLRIAHYLSRLMLHPDSSSRYRRYHP